MSAPFIQANTNGRLHDAREASVAPLNRGFLYGDAIYEVWRTYHGVIFAWEEHWARLERSARALHLTLPFSPAEILAKIKRTAAAWRAATGDSSEIYIRLQVTRGGGPIGLDPALADRADFVILVQKLALPTAETVRTGLKLALATTLHRNSPATLNPAWKTGNYLNNILCLREAKARGADEVVMTNLAGEITEAAVCNVAFLRDGTLVTPPLAAGILGGITRQLLLDKIATRAGVPTREETLRPADLAAMDECFLLSTTRDVQPVRAIDATNYRVGDGTVAMRLKTAFADYAAEQANAPSELNA
jgi:branched-subunit amino acid aminotransferase/4-amino-4-deoxychorismate lyase